MKRFIKKIASIALVMSLVISGSMFNVSGEKALADSDVLIYNEADWNDFADRVNDGESYLTAELMADFTATPGFECVLGQFCGSFDGNGHTISGLTTPMFDWLSEATVSNIVLRDVDIDPSFYIYDAVGAVADDVLSGSTVSNCVVYGSINSEGNDDIGGIAGYVDRSSSVYNCVNYASVSGRDFVGGIVGYLATGDVYDCVNEGTITSSGNSCGGIVGTVRTDADEDISNVYRSYNVGEINGVTYVGGVIGDTTGGLAVHSVYNNGGVSGTTYVGGIIGESMGDVSLSNAYSNGDISSSNQIAGHILGDCERSNLAYVLPGTGITGSTSYSEEDFTSGKMAYELNSYAGFESDWTYWSFDGENVFFADADNARAYKVSYMDGANEYAVAYTMNDGSYEQADSPADVDGELFAGWFTNNLGTISTVDNTVLAQAVDFTAPVAADTVYYPVYLTVGTLQNDPADTNTYYDNRGFSLDGVQCKQPANGSKAGLRFMTRISKELIRNVEALNANNVSLKPESKDDKGIGFGTVVIQKRKIPEGAVVVKDVNAKSTASGMFVSPAVNIYRDYTDYYIYTGLVTGIPESAYSVDLAARSYITYCDANGVERTYYYTETGSHNIGGAYYTSYQTVWDYYNSVG
ncbi:MAG: hypothetical protein IJM37_09940 [Lachnospiraceae bacterium]|nr:hypothetical protein [Lachnospiraceae bacterium]